MLHGFLQSSVSNTPIRTISPFKPSVLLHSMFLYVLLRLTPLAEHSLTDRLSAHVARRRLRTTAYVCANKIPCLFGIRNSGYIKTNKYKCSHFVSITMKMIWSPHFMSCEPINKMFHHLHVPWK